jgi:hypothetical protein
VQQLKESEGLECGAKAGSPPFHCSQNLLKFTLRLTSCAVWKAKHDCAITPIHVQVSSIHLSNESFAASMALPITSLESPIQRTTGV